MNAGLKALLERAVDYAGMFPPASLSLRDAAFNYADYRQTDDAWMLGQFVLPAQRLEELGQYVGDLAAGTRPFPCAVIGRGGDDCATWMSAFEEDLADGGRFLDQHGDRVAVPAIEVTVPAEVTATKDRMESMVERFLDEAASRLSSARLPAPTVYLEAPPQENIYQAQRAIILAITARRDGPVRFGFKLRTGGLTAAAIPPVEEIVMPLIDCTVFRCPWKATAGLHHPLRQYRPEVEAKMHGFLNLFVAAAIVHAHDPLVGDVVEMLNEEKLQWFHFGDDGVGWKDDFVTLADIGPTRRLTLASFGCCSFDQPRNDLRMLKLL